MDLCPYLPLVPPFLDVFLITFLVVEEYLVDPKTCTPNNIWWKFIHNFFIAFIL